MENQKMWTGKWSVESVIEYFDTHWDCTLHELGALSGWRKAELKKLLMGGAE